MTERWQAYLTEHRHRFVSEFVDLLRIESVSTDPALAGEVRRAAGWTAARLRQAGMEEVRILETGGHPVVYGEWLHAPGKPTVLFYGHFDVQPVDPLDQWHSPPFEPRVDGDRIYARGASDMKGNLLLPVIACEALLRSEGALPVNVKFLLEGEEEIGSPHLAAFIAAHRELLACDLTVSADGGVGTAEEPVVGTGSRGLCGFQIDIRSAASDLHSGAGGAVPNSIHALVRLLDSMRDPDGRILVEGFYEQVRPLSDGERAMIAAAPFDPAEFKARTGIRAFFGEPGFTPREGSVARPTLEVNGIWGGFQGDGIKTVIPAEAHAKITCRLVADQTPEEIRAKLAAHIERHAPAYAAVTVRPLPGEADPYLVPEGDWGLAALERTMAALCGRAPRHVRSGGTVPVMGMLKRQLGVETVTLGASQLDEQVHAPNEFTRISNFERIQRAYCLLLAELGR